MKSFHLLILAPICRHAARLAEILPSKCRPATDVFLKGKSRGIRFYQSLSSLNRGRLQGVTCGVLGVGILFVVFRHEPVATVRAGATGKHALPTSNFPDAGKILAEDSILSARTAVQDLMEQQQIRQAIEEEQARRQQAAAQEQSRYYQLQQLQMQRQAAMQQEQAVRQAREAAQSQMRRYEQDVSGTIGSILGE